MTGTGQENETCANLALRPDTHCLFFPRETFPCQARNSGTGDGAMNRRNLETLLLTLESTPALVAKAAAALDASQVRQVPAGGGFSLLEHVWHLADLESEGYGVRIRRILSETEPPLSDFEGEPIARERCYA